MKIIVSIFFLGMLLNARAQSKIEAPDTLLTKILSPTQMREDLAYLQQALEETHPGLYRYQTKEEWKQSIDRVAGLLNNEMPFYTYYGLLSAACSKINCAHTSILPTKDVNAMLAVCKTFPYWVFSINGHVFITASGTRDTVIKSGYELIGINGKPIKEIMTNIFSHLWADGHIEISKYRMLDDNFFSLFYYFFVEQPDSFTVECLHPDGKAILHKVSANTFPVNYKNVFENPVNKGILTAVTKRNQLNTKKPWRVEINQEENTAVLTIRGFGGGKNGSEASKKMDDFMEASLARIKKHKIDNLIIDLRLNHGGWDNQGMELFTYLIDSPAYYYRRFHTVSNNSRFLQYASISSEELANIKNELQEEKDGTFTVKPEFNYTLLLQEPKINRFKGKVFFLMDGASGSTTAEFLAMAHANHLGTFIGEECGGNYTGGNGGEFISLILPQSKIQVSIPLEFYENGVGKPEREGRGTFPDHSVPYQIKDIITATDTQLNFAKQLIKKGNNKIN